MRDKVNYLGFTGDEGGCVGGAAHFDDVKDYRLGLEVVLGNDFFVVDLVGDSVDFCLRMFSIGMRARKISLNGVCSSEGGGSLR